MLVYESESAHKSYAGKPLSQWGEAAVMRTWGTHIENHAFLKFMYAKGTMAEKQQASKELVICERKIAFWEKHPAFDKRLAALQVTKVKTAWAGK